MNKFTVSALSILATLGVATGGAVIYNTLPKTTKKLNLSWGDTVILGDKNNTTTEPEIIVEQSALDKLCQEQHYMYIAMLYEDYNLYSTYSIKADDHYDEDSLNSTIKAFLQSRPYEPVGSEFKGWSLTPNGELVESLQYEEKVVILYSIWEHYETIPVTFYVTPGSFNNVSYRNGQYSYLPTESFSEDLDFLGYTLNPDATSLDELIDLEIFVPDENMTYYTMYRDEHGHIGTSEYVAVYNFITDEYSLRISGFNNELDYLTERAKSLRPTDREGYTFVGWSTSELPEDIVDFNNIQLTFIPYDMNYYAIWEANK